MSITTPQSSNSLDLILGSILKEVSENDFNTTKSSLENLTSQENAYTCIGGGPNRWNMITYKNGQKSSL